MADTAAVVRRNRPGTKAEVREYFQGVFFNVFMFDVSISYGVFLHSRCASYFFTRWLVSRRRVSDSAIYGMKGPIHGDLPENLRVRFAAYSQPDSVRCWASKLYY
jgi:hypothetical protein